MSKKIDPRHDRAAGDEHAGLANEPRPGLGARQEEHPEPAPRAPRRDDAEPRAPAAAKNYRAPRPEPQETDPASLEQELQRSTGVSGHMSGT